MSRARAYVQNYGRQATGVRGESSTYLEAHRRRHRLEFARIIEGTDNVDPWEHADMCKSLSPSVLWVLLPCKQCKSRWESAQTIVSYRPTSNPPFRFKGIRTLPAGFRRWEWVYPWGALEIHNFQRLKESSLGVWASQAWTKDSQLGYSSIIWCLIK
jgi:hypothetical protein